MADWYAIYKTSDGTLVSLLGDSRFRDPTEPYEMKVP